MPTKNTTSKSKISWLSPDDMNMYPHSQSFSVSPMVKPQVVNRDGYGTTTASGIKTDSKGNVSRVAPISNNNISAPILSQSFIADAPPALPEPPKVDYASLSDEALGGYDSAYKIQLEALRAALSGQLADFTAQRGFYDNDLSQAMRQLGIEGQVFDDPLTADVNEFSPGQWMWDDRNTVAGKADYNLKNNFASRGVLQSSLFRDSKTDLDRSLSDQVTNLGEGRTSFLQNLNRQQTAAEQGNTSAINNARMEAIYRLAQGIGV